MWSDFKGNQEIYDRFTIACKKNRIAGSYLFVGPPGIGKRKFALLMAKSLLCEKTKADEFDFCGECPSCAQVDASTHQTLNTFANQKKKIRFQSSCSLGIGRHRMRDGLCHRISLRAFSGGRKVAIIDDADFLNQEGANCLLKKPLRNRPRVPSLS